MVYILLVCRDIQCWKEKIRSLKKKNYAPTVQLYKPQGNTGTALEEENLFLIAKALPWLTSPGWEPEAVSSLGKSTPQLLTSLWRPWMFSTSLRALSEIISTLINFPAPAHLTKECHSSEMFALSAEQNLGEFLILQPSEPWCPQESHQWMCGDSSSFWRPAGLCYLFESAFYFGD